MTYLPHWVFRGFSIEEKGLDPGGTGGRDEINHALERCNLEPFLHEQTCTSVAKSLL